MKEILITGINGFLGSRLARSLSSHYHVIGIEKDINNLHRLKNLEFKVYSSDYDTLDKIFENHDFSIVIHTATLYGKNEPDYKLIDANFLQPLHLLEYSILKGISVFVNTDTVLEKYTNTYSLSKNQFKDWLYFRCSKIQVINIQLEHVYGPGSSNNNFITLMIERLRKNDTSIDLTKGDQKRDFIFIDDVINAYSIILNNLNNIEDPFNNFQIGTGQLISIKELMIMLKDLTGSSSQLNFNAIPYRDKEIMESHIDISKILALGWKPIFDFKNGLIRTLKGV